MACLATEEQTKLAIKMLNKTKYIASEYEHKKQTNNLNNSAKEKDQKETRGRKTTPRNKDLLCTWIKRTSNKIMKTEHQPICHQ